MLEGSKGPLRKMPTDLRSPVDPLDSGCQNIGHLETPGDGATQFMSVSAAARHLGYESCPQLYKFNSFDGE